MTASELAAEIWGDGHKDSRSGGARIIRLVARELFPEQAPGKGRAWRFTKGQASKIRRHRRVKTAFSA